MPLAVLLAAAGASGAAAGQNNRSVPATGGLGVATRTTVPPAADRRIWVQRYNPARNGEDEATAVAASPDGSTVFVTGQSDGTVGQGDYVTVAYDQSSGTQRWVRRFNGPGKHDDHPYAIEVSPDGSTVFVTGQSEDDQGEPDYLTVAY